MWLIHILITLVSALTSFSWGTTSAPEPMPTDTSPALPGGPKLPKYRVGEGSGIEPVWLAAYKKAYPRTMGSPVNAVHRWGNGCIQDFNGGYYSTSYMHSVLMAPDCGSQVIPVIGPVWEYLERRYGNQMVNIVGYPLQNRKTVGFLLFEQKFEHATVTVDESNMSPTKITPNLPARLPRVGASAGRGNYESHQNVEVATSYIGQWGGNACSDAGTPSAAYGGECKQFVNCVVRLASGGTVSVAGGYYSNYIKAGAVRVQAGYVLPGDIIQLNGHDPEQFYPGMHTAVVSRAFSGGWSEFEVIDSNFENDEKVRIHKWQPYERAERFGLIVNIWRIGQA